MISKARLGYIESNDLLEKKDNLLYHLRDENANTGDINPLNNITNCDFWIEKVAQKHLVSIFCAIQKINNETIQNLFLLAFSQTLRESSYTRNNEFKLFRMQEFQHYKPNVYEIFSKKLDYITKQYLNFYQPKLRDVSFYLFNATFKRTNKTFDTILTSPPYGDSKTTVAYGQFSTFINEWLGFKGARRLDSTLLGGKKSRNLYGVGIMRDYILEIDSIDKKRALEISSFYFDLESSIKSLVDSINNGGKSFLSWAIAG